MRGSAISSNSSTLDDISIGRLLDYGGVIGDGLLDSLPGAGGVLCGAVSGSSSSSSLGSSLGRSLDYGGGINSGLLDSPLGDGRVLVGGTFSSNGRSYVLGTAPDGSTIDSELNRSVLGSALDCSAPGSSFSGPGSSMLNSGGSMLNSAADGSMIGSALDSSVLGSALDCSAPGSSLSGLGDSMLISSARCSTRRPIARRLAWRSTARYSALRSTAQCSARRSVASVGDKALPHRLESGEEDEAGDMGDDERDGIGSLSPPPVVVQPGGPPAVAPQVAERPHVYVGASLR